MKESLKSFWSQKNLIIGILFTLLVITTTALICSHHEGRDFRRNYDGKYSRQYGNEIMNSPSGNIEPGYMMGAYGNQNWTNQRQNQVTPNQNLQQGVVPPANTVQSQPVNTQTAQ